MLNLKADEGSLEDSFEEENGGGELLQFVTIETYFDKSILPQQNRISISEQTVGELIFDLMGFRSLGLKVVAFCECWFLCIFRVGYMGFFINLLLSWLVRSWDPMWDAIVFSFLSMLVATTGIMQFQVEFLLLLAREPEWWIQMFRLYLGAMANFYSNAQYQGKYTYVYICGAFLIFFGTSLDAIDFASISPYRRCVIWAVVCIVSLGFFVREVSGFAHWDQDIETNLYLWSFNNHDKAMSSLFFSVGFSAKNLWVAIRKPGDFSLISARVRRKKDNVTTVEETVLGCFNTCKSKVKVTKNSNQRQLMAIAGSSDTSQKQAHE